MASTSKEGSKLDGQTKNLENVELQPPKPDYAKRPQRVKKEDLFMILALWMAVSEATMASTSKEGSKLDGQTKNLENVELQPPKPDYAKRPQRVKKEDLFMILAFWMGESPLAFFQTQDKMSKTKGQLLNGVGAVLVKPDNKIFALDCSREDGLHVTHGVTRLLMKFPRHAQSSSIYSSRKPCSLCTKLLVQCKVAKVFYLPIPPEINNKTDIAKVDHLFKVSEVAQRVFVPDINCEIISTGKKKEAHYSPMKENDKKTYIEEQITLWTNKYWNDDWVNTQLQEGLPWLAFDEKMEAQVSSDMKSMFEWISYVAITDPADYVKFKKIGDDPGQGQSEDHWQKLALHSTRLAKIVSHKTDDPNRGVGAVIMMNDESIVAIGWNGFPSKALYGDFPRASKSDKVVNEKKYPYVIHAEQNALLTRNKDDISSETTTLFVSKTPCNECVPLLYEAGVKKVVLPSEEKKTSEDTKSELDYDLFYHETFGFEIFFAYTSTPDAKLEKSEYKARKKLVYE